MDSYSGWQIAPDIAEKLKASGVKVPTGDSQQLQEESCAFAKQMQSRRIAELDAEHHEWDSRNLSHLEPNTYREDDGCLYRAVLNSSSARPDPNPHSPQPSMLPAAQAHG